MADLAIRGLSKSFGVVDVLKDINLDIESGRFVVFVGPSGCGKSTLLRTISGLEDITSGTLEIDGAVMNDVGPSKRGIAMVFQSYALYPHMTVFKNIAFGLEMSGMARAEIRNKVEAVARTLQLSEYLDRLPKHLSGGQRQRVAIGRAIVRDPRVFLFDEPLSNLDAALRVQMRIEIANLKRNMPNTTMIYVTHDQVEAMTMGDQIVVLREGRIEQVGAPLELYNRPQNRFVAGFICSPAMNFFPVTGSSDGSIRFADGTVLRYGKSAPRAGEVATVGLRPEHCAPAKGRARGPAIKGRVRLVESLGNTTMVYLTGRNGDFIAQLSGQQGVAEGGDMAVALARPALHFFDREGHRVELN
jgi:ABC-type sugar transport system ATPase subunit